MSNSVWPGYWILLADDDRLYRETVREVLQPFFGVIEAENGSDALEIACTTPVHIVLLDVQMPSLSGLETVRELVHRQVTFPCVLMTANSTPELERDAREVNVVKVLHKPVSRRGLISTLADVVGSWYSDHSFQHRVLAAS